MPVGARRAVSAIFFVNGFLLASWVPHVPAVKHAHALSDGALGLVLLCMAAGAVAALPVAGGLVDRVGSRRMTSLAALALCAALPLPVVSGSVPLLAIGLFALGACNATLDVSMNAQAAAVELRYGRAIMSSFHGLFSIGGLGGAACAAGVMAAGAGDVAHVFGTAAACFGVVLACLPALLPSPAPPARSRTFAWPGRALLALGVLAFCGLLAEGAIGDWSAVYLHDALGSSPAVAATGFAAFSLAMAAGRLGGDALVRRLGRAQVLAFSSAAAAMGLGAALAVGTPLAGIAGCAVVGLGIANVIPIVFSAAARTPGVEAGTALAAVATTGYAGFVAGPPLIGVGAELAGLRVALGAVAALCALIAVGAGRVGRDDRFAARERTERRSPCASSSLPSPSSS